VSGCCEAHQAHRIIELRWKGLIGDVHAIAMCGANPAFQNRMQVVLKSMLDRMVYVRGHVLQ
jgi:hypothetical protein